MTDTRPDMPLGTKLDKHGNILSHKNKHGNWFEFTRDEAGNVLMFVSSDGSWY